MKKLREMLKNEKGFTLIELLAVIVILGIIAAIAVPAIGSLIASTEEDAHDANALSLLESARLAFVSGDITEADSPVSADTLVTEGYLDGVPQDPETDAPYTTAQVTINNNGDSNQVTYQVTLGADAGGNNYITNATKSELNGQTD
ncbi:prepilin-type N-terminal cleavage/methylation domain-containing protein [Halobacillus litoralis]|uniref:Prepilin-type N-terminal cleavage/methylation domain-containing protein n=1 Tax=Halobacillus litoralis TaxID=45668 RepID=A0A845E4J5_9BACI|nr:prepilin-type N-terminal cleavage/methylation domain-containing protein [Halobacillus litoralis]MYL50200.1 prepilin-type N-terminal cleavage/methylation domain-containing protein [Halobacillus litoralis]